MALQVLSGEDAICAQLSREFIYKQEETRTQWHKFRQSSACYLKKCPAQVLRSQRVTGRKKQNNKKERERRTRERGSQRKSWDTGAFHSLHRIAFSSCRET